METACRALAAVFDFAWKCGLILIAAALLAAMASGEGGGASTEPSRADAPLVASKSAGDSVWVPMNLAPGRLYANCTLLDAAGNELLRASYGRDGCLWVELGDAFPVRPSFTAVPDGGFQFIMLDQDNLYRFRGRRHGVSGFTIFNHATVGAYGIGVTEDGAFVDDTNIIE